MSPATIADVAERLRPAQLAGSLLAAPNDQQLRYAQLLTEANAWVHVDLIDAAYPAGAGVRPEILDDLVQLGCRLDLHLLLDDPLTSLDAVLRYRPHRITVQCEDLFPDAVADIANLTRKCHAARSQLWIGIAPTTDPDTVGSLLDRADGTLIMLSDPGRPGAVRQPAMINRLYRIRAQELAVDGGVTEEIFPDLRQARVSHTVIGRWLWSAIRPSRDGGSNSHPTQRVAFTPNPGECR